MTFLKIKTELCKYWLAGLYKALSAITILWTYDFLVILCDYYMKFLETILKLMISVWLDFPCNSHRSHTMPLAHTHTILYFPYDIQTDICISTTLAILLYKLILQ